MTEIGHGLEDIEWYQWDIDILVVEIRQLLSQYAEIPEVSSYMSFYLYIHINTQIYLQLKLLVYLHMWVFC